MAFTSHIFLFYFLPAILLLYHLVPSRWPAARNVLLLAAGYAFYAWLSPWFAVLLLGLTVVNYVVSRFLASAGAKTTRLALTGLAVTMDLAVLGFFKYIVFVEENLNSLLLLVGHDALPVLRIVLPVGISFYTFKITANVVDVHRDQSPPARFLLDFACYVSFFRSFLSGPIQPSERSTQVGAGADLRRAACRPRAYARQVRPRRSAVHAGVRQEDPPGQRGRPGSGRGLRRRGAGDARCVVRGPGLFVSTVLRFLRVLGNGHRDWLDARLRVPSELRRAVPGRELRGFLATMAFLAVVLAARLSVTSAGRQRAGPDAPMRIC